MFSAEGGNFVFGLSEKRAHLLRVLKKDLSRRRKRDVRPGTIEELNAKIFLKRLDLKAHRGLREVEFFGGFAEAELFRNRAKDDGTEVFEARHGMIRTPTPTCGAFPHAARKCSTASGRGRRVLGFWQQWLGDGQFDLDLRRREQRVVHQAVVYGAHESLGLVFRERRRAQTT